VRGLRLQLTKQQAKDLAYVLSFELTVPKAINAKVKAWGGKGLPQDEIERLSESMTTIHEKAYRLSL
jgi:hypothetical protein